MARVSLLLASFVSLAVASPAFKTFIVQEKLASVPEGFASLGPASADTVVNLRMALPSKDAAGLHATLLDVSDPKSANYGKHLSKDEANAFLAPTADAVSTVQEWLSSKGLVGTVSAGAGDWLSVSANVSTANELLSAKYETFQHIDSGKTYHRTLSYSLPAEVTNLIDHIHPTVIFDTPISPNAFLSIPRVPSKPADSCTDSITPSCLQSLCNIPSTKVTAEAANSIAVAGFADEWAQTADLQSFLRQFRPDMSSSTTFILQTLDNGTNTQSPEQAGDEANCDVQYTVGVATGVPVSFISVGGNSEDRIGGFLDIVHFLSDEDNIPPVMTVSYGFYEPVISKTLAFKLCDAYAAVGARGVSVLFPSGDSGASGQSGSGQFHSCHRYRPTFPSGCPFVTSVGSVHGISREIGSSFSSGGFSNYWDAPDYQAFAVAAFLKAQGSTDAGLFNASGRGFPDVSVQGENYQIVNGSKTYSVSGTSASTPAFASIIALINNDLIAAKKPPLGFLNPWLYANADMLSDVTSGSNPGCGTDGFLAIPGWDPVTGLGTPDYEKMKRAAFRKYN
ncbi:family S53 protease [Roridomyces roridus]|uniref:Family S53 protease n=1 Tax=Roridomyces roridus TaxID=1738132 RepID=A0AAD7FV99_9AGAR|nr:family S53 protease [Roridomyces roridus]